MKNSDGMRSFVCVSVKAQEASFLVAELVAKTKNSHTIAETLPKGCTVPEKSYVTCLHQVLSIQLINKIYQVNLHLNVFLY